MYNHLLANGYMLHYVTTVDFDQHERDRGEVMRQRLNGNEFDGVRDMLDDLQDAEIPDSPPSEPEEPPEPEEAPEPEEPEPVAKAFYDMLTAAKKPLYEGAKMSQLDAISQCLADKTHHNFTRAGYEAALRTSGNRHPCPLAVLPMGNRYCRTVSPGSGRSKIFGRSGRLLHQVGRSRSFGMYLWK